jgi:hypothetical protein
MMKNILTIFSLITLSFMMSSCLESDLDELPLYGDAEITDVDFEYRYIGTSIDTDELDVTTMTVTKTIDSDDCTIIVDIVVPDADDSFTESEREEVTLENLACYLSVSTASIVTSASIPLGETADYSSEVATYTIEAADGTTKEWTLTISSFIK